MSLKSDRPDGRHLVGVLCGLTAFTAYLTTLSPTVSLIDSGELATVACTLGIAHPSGYPLFTLIGRLWVMLPVVHEEIARLNILAAFLTAAGVVAFYYSVRHLLLRLASDGALGLKPAAPWGWMITAASAGASLILAFSETVWSVALSLEVYSLHILLVCAALVLFLEANSASVRGGGTMPRLWLLFAYVLGLSFSNHLTTMLLAPGFLTLYFITQGGGWYSWQRILRMVVPFLLGLSTYLYLPLRALGLPLLSWGDVTSLERFVWHVSGRQYRVWIFSSVEAAGRQFKYFISTLPGEFALVGLLLGLVGAWVLLVRDRKMFLLTLILFLTCVLYSMNYDIHDIDSYFLLAYIVIALWAGCGLLQVGAWLAPVAPLRQKILIGVLLLPALASVLSTFGRVDRSHDFAVEDYTMNMFSSFEPGALVLSYQWDYWVSAAYYYQCVKGVHQDVTVVDKELLRRSWYLKQLGRHAPWLIERSEPEVDAFLKEVFKFEHDLPYNPVLIEARYAGMIVSFIRNSLPDHHVYVTPEIEQEYTQGFQRVPEGLAFRLIADTLFHPAPFPEFQYRPLGDRDKYLRSIRSMYAGALVARGDYFRRWGSEDEARRAYVAAQVHDPNAVRLGGRAPLPR